MRRRVRRGDPLQASDLSNSYATVTVDKARVIQQPGNKTFRVYPAESKTKVVDVPADAEYAQAVAWAVEKDVTAGMTADAFQPNATCSRGQIATFLYRNLAK